MVDLPHGQAVVGCRWVYKIKTKVNAFVEWYKACLVAKGFTQEYGIDFEETFAPVASLTYVRCIIVVAAIRCWPFYQMDVKNAFLNRDLQEEVYMQPPPGYTYLGHQVCRLHRALYGFKQVPRSSGLVWKFSSVVAQQGFTSSPHDTAPFVRRSSVGITLIILYIDDMIIIGDDFASIHSFQHFLS